MTSDETCNGRNDDDDDDDVIRCQRKKKLATRSIDRFRQKKNLIKNLNKNKKKQASLAAPAFIYVRVKRRSATYFLRVEPTERVGSLKAKLEELVQRSPGDMRLVKLGGGGGSGGGGRGGGNSDPAAAAAASSSVNVRNQEHLDDDDARLADVGVGNDDVLALCFKEKGTAEGGGDGGGGGGGWEKVDVGSLDRGGGGEVE